jgi:hypothetical protein
MIQTHTHTSTRAQSNQSGSIHTTTYTVNKTTSPDILLLASTNIHSLTATMSSSIYATPAPSQAIERQLFDLANQVALYYAQTFHWSSFHAFNAVSQADANFESLPTDGKAFWEALISFGSCLGASTLIYHALRDAVANHAGPEVAKYADTVQLMTCAQHVSSEMQYHAIVAMCFRSFAFAIDHSLHPTAFKVPVGGEFAMFAYIPLFSNLGQERFKYYVSDSGVYMLTMDSTMITYSALAFTPQYVSTTVSQIAIPAASETKPVKGGDSDVLLPPRKYVSVHTLLNEEPKYIPSAPIHGKYLTTAIRSRSTSASQLYSSRSLAWTGSTSLKARRGFPASSPSRTISRIARRQFTLSSNSPRRQTTSRLTASSSILICCVSLLRSSASRVLLSMRWWRPSSTSGMSTGCWL